MYTMSSNVDVSAIGSSVILSLDVQLNSIMLLTFNPSVGLDKLTALTLYVGCFGKDHFSDCSRIQLWSVNDTWDY